MVVPPWQAAERPICVDPRRGAPPPCRDLPPGLVAPAKPALGSGTLARGRRGHSAESCGEPYRPPLGVPLRARASPAPRTGGGFGGGRRGPLRENDAAGPLGASLPGGG